MGRRRRIIASLTLLGLSALAAMFFGGQVGSCLGPIGVTAVQCIRATGITPTVGAGMPVAAGLGVAAALALFPVNPEARGRLIVGGLAGAVVAAIGYVAFHQTSMTGPTSTGEVITIQLPIDAPGLVAFAIAGAGIAGLLSSQLGGRSATAST